MIILSFIISFVYITSNTQEDQGEPKEAASLRQCLKEFLIKFSKNWLHFILIMYKSRKSKLTIFVEIIIHYGLFLIASGCQKYITVFGTLFLLELSSVFLFSFIEGFLLQSAYYYQDLILILLFYSFDAVFFFNAIPSLVINWILFGVFHIIAFVLSLKQFQKEKKIVEKPLQFEAKKIINIGKYRGKNCILAETIQPKEVQLIQLDTMKVIGYAPLQQKASLKSFLPQTQLIIIQENEKLDIFCLRTFKMIKQFDMNNLNIKTAETVRIHKIDQSIHHHHNNNLQQIEKSPNQEQTSKFTENNEFQDIPNFMTVNNNKSNDEEIILKKKSDQNSDLESQKKKTNQKLYIVHDSKPLIAEISMVNNETSIRVINFLTNFEERQLQLTMPIVQPEQLIQFVRIDGTDKIFFKSPQNSFCLIDINKNLSDIVKQYAQSEIICNIINERDIALTENDNLYLYDIPANLFTKKITKFHMGSYVIPIQNAPGFYLILPSEDHAHRIHPDIAQLINEQLFSFRIISNKILKTLKVQAAIYDVDSKKLNIFTDSQVIVESNINLQQAEQPLVSDHVVLDISIYQQAHQEQIQ
ncbi:transmembrane protein, putative (macronuclear) [Tetrahymena thermophila SB210]|uniref:Transmembrane protein, putative n=1 Tax=Tetrahymena thermophila (strain SB210) TaxID=312017 RepID=Q22M97_TETTS|nr:transmembrane protein, putative [Tetrahymena thermophila SB210]EAR86667.2 transmembrane protein, putative [Tetrahymena thermophila SB210]|eukprot:XP_977123.2 transmembrane protein, putative [Tetrahymena thermophila SB210]